eukprot:m.115751 g.115751  ORF g.115751 m.115751 type:complete len:105 (-) comp14454_c0_seq3:40-354(-)
MHTRTPRTHAHPPAVFGVPLNEPMPFPITRFFRKNVHLIGSVFPHTIDDFSLAVSLIAQQRVSVDPLFTSLFSLTDCPLAMHAFQHCKGQHIKIVVAPRSVLGE